MKPAINILVADDEVSMRSFIAAALRDEGYNVAEYDPENSKANILQKQYDVAIVDIMMPGMDGFELRKEIAKHSPDTQFIFITGQADAEKLEKAIGLGVYMFMPKPFQSEHIRYAVLGALKMKELYQKNIEYRVADGANNMGLVGKSSHIRSLRQIIMETAPMEVSVLITGESGTGKEIVAGCIHQFSCRASKPFIAVNMASLSPSLIESELFGHVQGAFTGAAKTKHGFFETAEGGTLFLDEIGDLRMELQSKLLRVLDKGEFCRVGDANSRIVNIRIISATNWDLAKMVKENRFRKDLYYRLRGTEIRLSPLRERKEDIPYLLSHFLGDNGPVILPCAMEALCEFKWPGNVRELKAVANNFKVLATKKIVNGELASKVLGLNASGDSNEKEIIPFNIFKADTERKYFESLLESTGQNISKASKLSGLDRTNFRNKLKSLSLYHENEKEGFNHP